MNYEIVATLGPASNRPETWKALLFAGATAFRLNTSHLTLVQLTSWLTAYQAFFDANDSRPPLVLDLQGSKWRLGQFPSCELAAGETVSLVYARETAQPGVLPVPHLDFFAAAAGSNGELVLNDARVRLVIETAAPDVIRARVVLGGTIASNKGITLAASEFRKESINEKDQTILEQTQDLAWIRYAISYVRDAAEMRQYRDLISPKAYLIAKLERQPALDEAEQIAQSADELWLCRGDLGAELGQVAMAKAVHGFSQRVARFSPPVILAGQVLEHMTEHSVPTRSELCYLYDALQTGYQGVVLSDETAVGHAPIEACRTAALFKQPASM